MPMTLGMAQRLYLSQNGNLAPWKTEPERPAWKNLYQTLDHAVASALSKELGITSEACVAALCHLCAAVQQGHLCLQVTTSTVSPSLYDLFGPVEVDVSALESLISEGVALLKEQHSPFLHYADGRLYFQRHWIAETQFIEHVIRLRTASPTVPVDQDSLASQLDGLVLEEEQADAIRKVGSHALTVITGGPGTGKTYTAGQCLRLLWLTLSPDQCARFHISLAAPTGKAAANLEAKVMPFVSSLEGFPPVKAQTLHSLLELKRSTEASSVGIVLPSDLIIVDECSMIDAQLFAQLLAAVKSGTRLILMGDAEQLPAVEAGGLFFDLVQAISRESCLAQLKQCRRTESKDILHFSAAVKRGDWQSVQTLFNEGHDVKRLDFVGSQHLQHRQFLRQTIPRFQCDMAALEDPECLSDYLRRFRLLSPVRKGPWGVDTLNALFEEHAATLGLQAFPIMITKNNDRQSLFNGDLGVFVRSHGHNDYALFTCQDGVRRLSAHRLPAYEFAYCLSVHKSQGSEFDHVVLIVPEGSEHFGRELFYTAATRARRRLEVLGADDRLREMLCQHTQRISGVRERLGKNPCIG